MTEGLLWGYDVPGKWDESRRRRKEYAGGAREDLLECWGQ